MHAEVMWHMQRSNDSHGVVTLLLCQLHETVTAVQIHTNKMLANSFLARDVDLWELASELLRISHLILNIAADAQPNLRVQRQLPSAQL